MTNEPAAGTVDLTNVQVASAVRIVVKISDDVLTSEFVTVIAVAAAAKFTVPAVLLIVRLPVVPPAVIVRCMLNVETS